MKRQLTLLSSAIRVEFGGFVGITHRETEHKKACADIAQKSSYAIVDGNYYWSRFGLVYSGFGGC